jgi:hypothetical protein
VLPAAAACCFCEQPLDLAARLQALVSSSWRRAFSSSCRVRSSFALERFDLLLRGRRRRRAVEADRALDAGRLAVERERHDRVHAEALLVEEAQLVSARA